MISSAASAGISPSSPCTLASAASMSRYFAVRFSSDQTSRMRRVAKMPWKMAESMMVDGMAVLRSEGVQSARAGQRAGGLQHHRAVDHAAVEPGGSG